MSEEQQNTPKELRNTDDESVHQADFGELLQENAALSPRAKEEVKKYAPLFQRMFGNDELSRIAKDSRLKEAKSGYEFREKMLRIAMDFRKKQTEEKYTSLLQTYQLKYRNELYRFAMDKLDELNDSMLKKQDKFFETIQKQMENAVKYRENGNDKIAVKCEEMAEKQLEELTNWLHKLVDEYKTIVDQKVGSES